MTLIKAHKLTYEQSLCYTSFNSSTLVLEMKMVLVQSESSRSFGTDFQPLHILRPQCNTPLANISGVILAAKKLKSYVLS